MSNQIIYDLQIRWADIDANRHLRHSVYYDYGASMRMKALSDRGLTIKKFEEFGIGPILFREEAIFKKEIVFEDRLRITIELVKATEDYGRWSLRHNFIKDEDTVAAILNIDGAFIDLQKRKLAPANDFIKEVFEYFPKSHDFEFVVPQKKTIA
jgi:acyl-CoA thioester hydrolase